jgi:hypothetical protein
VRALIAIGLALLVSACVREPKEADLLQALRRYHQDWVTIQRRLSPSADQPLAPLVNLPREASLSLHIHGVVKQGCRPARDADGFLCSIEVIASTPYVMGMHRRIEARFVEGTRGWLLVSPRAVES